MKFHVLYISIAIGLLAHSYQAAPLLGNVADVTSDRLDIPAEGVHVDSEGVHVHQDSQDQGGLLQKRSPLLNNQGMNSVNSEVGNDGGLLNELLSKRQTGGGLTDPAQFGSVEDLVAPTLSTASSMLTSVKKRNGSNDDDGDDLLKPMHSPPPGATYGSGMAANRPEALMDAMTKRGGEEEEGGDDDNDASSNGENNQDHPGPPPAGLTDEQLDDYFTKH